jgi:UDP-N-acetylglucosamine--N-acetylmuramyl-(pentapeptide) pyrophosphoryl-undecaprenol N-acetylglucosamine transferase
MSAKLGSHFMPKIMFTGGGSAGHVTVNLALFPRLRTDGWSLVYVGSVTGIERELVRAKDVRYIGISTGKLRRYFDLRNFSDQLRIVKGIFQAYTIIRREKPAVLFSKGGFVSVPVVIGAWLNKVPIIIHESDLTPGLANRIATRFAHTICTTFKESENYLPAGKTSYVGALVREELNFGDARLGKTLCRFSDTKPVVLVMGGSLGAQSINHAVRESLPRILERFNVVHLCGKGNVDASYALAGYRQYEYLNEELPHVLSAADIVVSRAGSNSIFEFLHLRKPMLLIPLTKAQSRGDQILNAESFESAGLCRILHEEEMTSETLLKGIHDVYSHCDEIINNMENYQRTSALSVVTEIIKQAAANVVPN